MRFADKLNWISVCMAALGMVAVMLSGCAHRPSRQPPCVSYCGMLLDHKGNGSMSCDVLDDAESYMLDQIDKEFCSVDVRMCKENACKAIFGYQLQADEDVIIFHEVEPGVRIPAVGLTNCDMKMMWLGANQDWKHGSYPHELFHAIQDCSTGWSKSDEPKDVGPGHEGWQSNGVYDFIDEIRKGYR